ncbi:hypothetical protein [Streptomyces sp. MA15]|uniref:hypothetical protein n=1 Tax=Streptomyces sp. MA15 TaxID=3055061 RepID=UPI0025B1A675|nr:hypothetical protein [Streptomyces sp. MA15]MDN3271197.1 hypothetical protein [Streptomyces sp. MA15]
MPELLADVTTRIVVPVTTLPGPGTGEPCEDTFALEALGRVFVTSLRIWAQTSGRTRRRASPSAAIDFTQQFLTKDHEDVADTLRQLEAVGVGQPLDTHLALIGAHPVWLGTPVQASTGCLIEPGIRGHRTQTRLAGARAANLPVRIGQAIPASTF